MGGTKMVRAMSSWGIPTEVLAQRIAQVERKLGTDLLRRVLRAGKSDLWSVSIDLQRGRYVAIWTHYRAEKVIGRYSVVVERHGETLADGITACTCPDHQREIKRFGGWCKHELLTLFLLNPDLADTAANFIKLICKVSEPKEPVAEDASQSQLVDPLERLPEWLDYPDPELDLA
jgi:hypothetical protein